MKKNNYVKPLSKVVKVEIETQLLKNSEKGLPEVGEGGDAWGVIQAEPNQAGSTMMKKSSRSTSCVKRNSNH